MEPRGGFEVADLEDALYVRQSVVRVLGMRRTMFVVRATWQP